MNKLMREFKDFVDFLGLYSGYSTVILIIGFILGTLHKYYGL